MTSPVEEAEVVPATIPFSDDNPPACCSIASDAGKGRWDFDNRPIIAVTPREYHVNDQALSALCRDRDLFQRGNQLVRVVRGDNDTGLGDSEQSSALSRIAVVKEPVLRERMTRVARFVERCERGGRVVEEDVHPPPFCVRAISAREDWPGIRRLRGLSSVPVLRPDGTILTTPGFDPATGIFFQPVGPIVDVPDKPTKDQAIKARDAVLAIVEDFPFRADIHRAAWLAGLFTMVGRYTFQGPCPLFLFDANAPGTGKGMLADVMSVIATGRTFSRKAWPGCDREMRKTITAVAIAGSELLVFDNVSHELTSPSLEAALTCTAWHDRILGRSLMVDLPLTCVFAASGNNVRVGGDMGRRVCHVRLETQLEKPEERSDFHRPQLLKWVKTERLRLFSATLTMLAAFCRAGQPDQSLPPWGSFEGWSALVRAAIVWLGLQDAGATRGTIMRSSDGELGALRVLVNFWGLVDPENRGLTASQLLLRLDGDGERCQALREAILELCPAQSGPLPNPRSVGNRFRRLRGRVVDGKAIDSREEHGTCAWFVRRIG